MAGVLLYENILENATYVSAESVNAEQSGFEYQNCIDGRLDTAGKFDDLTFDLLGPDESAGGNGNFSGAAITLDNADKQPHNYYVGYTVTLTSGTYSGNSAKVTAYDYITRVCTLDASLGAADAAVTYTLRKTPEYDCIAFAGHNIQTLTSSLQLRVRAGDTLGAYTSTNSFGSIRTPSVHILNLTNDNLRYLNLKLVGASGEGFISSVYVGRKLELGDTFDHFALRAPFSPAGIYQTLDRQGKTNNNGNPLPSSYRKKGF